VDEAAYPLISDITLALHSVLIHSNYTLDKYLLGVRPLGSGDEVELGVDEENVLRLEVGVRQMVLVQN